MTDIVIMVVDDAPDNLQLLEMILGDRYQLILVSSGKECLELISQSVPDILLLDVNMPKMSGYDVCSQLRCKAETRTLPILFVSAMINTEERLAGFEAGGDDYIIKPVDGAELIEKIENHVSTIQEKKLSDLSTSEAMEVAMDAMTSSSELGLLIDFVSKTQQASTLPQMAKMLTEVCSEFGLNVNIYIEGSDPEFFGCAADSIEAIILERSLTSKERIVNLGIRTIVKSEQMSVLVKNMPIEDENRYGRFKDHLAVLIGISDGRLLTIKAHMNLAGERRKILNKVIINAESQIKNLNQKVDQHDALTRSIMSDLLGELEAKLFNLGLEEDQENQLMQLAYHASESLEKSKGSTRELHQELGGVLEGLYEVLAQNE